MKVPCFPSFEFINWRTADDDNDDDGNDEVDYDYNYDDDDDDDNNDDDSVRAHGARFRHRRESGMAN